MQIDCLFHRVTVRIVSPRTLLRHYEGKRKRGEMILGFYSSSRNTIFLSSKLEKNQALHTLGHEWGHALLHQLGVSLPSSIEEEKCDSLGTMLIRQFKAESFEDLLV